MSTRNLSTLQTSKPLTLPSSLITRYYLIPLLILLAAAAIQFHALVQDVRFFPDEALFSTFARRAALNGEWLLPGDLDKPPLSIYASALAMHFFAASPQNGVLDFAPRLGEFAARLPGAFAYILLVAITYALARRLYDSRAVAAWAAVFVAFSPYGAVYGSTAYTDGLMLMFAALSALLAARGNWIWGGVAIALAFASKHQALYLLPLALALGWLVNGMTVRRLLAYFVPFAAGVALLLGWDSLRAPFASTWTLAAANNPVRLAPLGEAIPRLRLWLEYSRTLVGTPTVLLAIGASFMVGWRVTYQWRERASRIDVALFVYILAYLLVHALVGFNIYSRYLLPLIFPMALLSARALLWLWAWVRPRLGEAESKFLAAALVLTLLIGARNASETRANFSEDGNIYSGITALADYLNAQPVATVIYDHWLGWELGYYMGEWNDKRRVYYPDPEALVHDALLLDETEPRYFVAPTRENPDEWLNALRDAGFEVERSYLQDGFAAYRLIPPAGLSADG